jgi:hypothetical protein
MVRGLRSAGPPRRAAGPTGSPSPAAPGRRDGIVDAGVQQPPLQLGHVVGIVGIAGRPGRQVAHPGRVGAPPGAMSRPSRRTSGGRPRYGRVGVNRPRRRGRPPTSRGLATAYGSSRAFWTAAITRPSAARMSAARPRPRPASAPAPCRPRSAPGRSAAPPVQSRTRLAQMEARTGGDADDRARRIGLAPPPARPGRRSSPFRAQGGDGVLGRGRGRGRRASKRFSMGRSVSPITRWTMALRVRAQSSHWTRPSAPSARPTAGAHRAAEAATA